MCLNILIVTAMYPHPGNEGYGAFVMHQVEQLRQMGHTVEVFHFPGYRSKLEYLKAAVAIFRRTLTKNYSIVHAHYGVTGLPALFRNSSPLVITLHGSDALLGWMQPLISRFVCRLADATIVVSSQINERISGEIIPCGVDLAIFEPKPKADARRQLGLSESIKYVLFPFDPARRVKRFDLAWKAVQRLKAEGMSVELLTVSKVHYREMPWYYSATDAMILCSASEGSPTSVKEALACNLPVVSTDVGDVKEIAEGIQGVEFSEPTPEALAIALKRVLSLPEGFASAGRMAMERFSQKTTAEAIVRVYHRAIERRTLLPHFTRAGKARVRH